MSLWRVQVLPLGTVSYGGRDLDFTREYLEHVVEAFDDGVFDCVPFQLAEARGGHTSDPCRYRGDVRSLEVDADGLDAVIAATPEGDEAIRTAPASLRRPASLRATGSLTAGCSPWSFSTSSERRGRSSPGCAHGRCWKGTANERQPGQGNRSPYPLR